MRIISEESEKRLKIKLKILFEDSSSTQGKFLNYFLVTLIGISILFFIFETTEFGRHYKFYFSLFDIFTIFVFSLEYMFRLYLAPSKKKFIFSPLSIIDALVILTFCFSFNQTSFLRSFRVFKMLQLLKFFRYSESSLQFFKSFANYKNEFKILGTIFFMAIILSSSGMYYLEKNANPNIQSLPDSLWWSAVTLSTVGYGDTVPVTLGGKFLAGIVIFLGLGLIAMFTAIITKMFIDHFFGKREISCSQCHFPTHDFDARFCKNCGNSLE